MQLIRNFFWPNVQLAAIVAILVAVSPALALAQGSMLTALVLMCSRATAPDHESCTQSNAIDVLRVPEDFASPVTCFMHGQAYVAATALTGDMTADQYVVVICSPIAKVASRAHILPTLDASD